MLALSVRSTDRSSRPPHFHRGAHVPDVHAALAMWTCGEALGRHRAEEPSCQASRAGEHGHPISTEEEQHRHTVQPHACGRVLQRGARLQQTGMKMCIFLCFISCVSPGVSDLLHLWVSVGWGGKSFKRAFGWRQVGRGGAQRQWHCQGAQQFSFSSIFEFMHSSLGQVERIYKCFLPKREKCCSIYLHKMYFMSN